MNTGWLEIDIHGWYSLVKIAFVPIYPCKNNRRIWRHNACTRRSRDVIDQLWWRHNAKSEKTVLWRQWRNQRSTIVFCGMVCSWPNIACKKWNNTFVTVNNDFLSLVMRFANDFHSWLRHVIGKSPHSWPKFVIHGNSCTILYVFHLLKLPSLSSGWHIITAWGSVSLLRFNWIVYH